MLKFVVSAFLCIVLLKNGVHGVMTEAQLQAAVKMVRNVCQPKTKASVAEIEGMHAGNWDIDHKTMCYMQCSLNMYKLMDKDNKFSMEVGMKLCDNTVPVARKDATLKSLTDCKDSAKTLNDKCIAAYEISKCIYMSDPSNYFLP